MKTMKKTAVFHAKSTANQPPTLLHNLFYDIFLKKVFLFLQNPILDVPLHRFFKEALESVAQQVEHIPFKDGVLGSSPSWFTFFCAVGVPYGTFFICNRLKTNNLRCSK